MIQATNYLIWIFLPTPNVLTMQISHSELKRFRLEGKLGEGADSEVFAATDAETALPVVVKRPHPTLIARRQHMAVERRIADVIALRQRLGNDLPHVTRMIGFTEPSRHDAYFGDDLDEEYTVFIEERAAGIPLVGSAMDGIKRHPVGLPQNLFALHPIIPHSQRGRFSIVRDLLEVAEAFQSAGSIILDMRPQNVYFASETGNIAVIDIGGVTQVSSNSRGRQPIDLHDFYLELFKWYVPTDTPPVSVEVYRHPVGMETVPMFHQNLDSMIRLHSHHESEPWNSAAIDALNKVKTRSYSGISEFRQDFEALLALLETCYAIYGNDNRYTIPWLEGKLLLTAPFWSKYLFDPRSLGAYGNRTD